MSVLNYSNKIFRGINLPARIEMVLPHGPTEESLATVARSRSVMFAGGPIATYRASLILASHRRRVDLLHGINGL